jgi:FkbH-like protein
MKLIEALEILRRAPSEEMGTFVVSLVCSFTPLHLQTMLAAQLQLCHPERRVKVQTGLYGDLLGNLARVPDSKSDAAVAVMEWQDFDPRLGIRSLGGWGPELLPEILENAQSRASLIVNAIEKASCEVRVGVCFPTLPLPPISYVPGWQYSSFEAELRACISKTAAAVARFPNIRLVNPGRLDVLSPLSERFDVKSEVSTGFPYQMSHVAVLAEMLASSIQEPTPKKGLITDLDDTLWKGIVGEIGPDAVAWDLDHHAQMHGVYQQLVHSLARAGTLVAVASKNEIRVVDEVFKKRSPILPAEAVFPMEVGWGPKSESVRHILNAWNIGADTVVFVDDSPMELAEVKAAHPEIECIQFPQDDPAEVYKLLERLRDLFGKSTLQEEDRIRLQSLRQASLVPQAGGGSGADPDSFLEQAQAELAVNFNTGSVDPRALELTNKTNQFNLNGRRHTEASLKEYAQDPGAFLMVVSYKDKYGPLGKIAVLAGRHSGEKVRIETWVMSCRAFSRRIEYRCLEQLIARFDANEIELDFKSTPRNQPLQMFLADILGDRPKLPCLLRKDDFLQRKPQTYQRVLETVNG